MTPSPVHQSLYVYKSLSFQNHQWKILWLTKPLNWKEINKWNITTLAVCRPMTALRLSAKCTRLASRVCVCVFVCVFLSGASRKPGCVARCRTFGERTVGDGDVQLALPGHLPRFVDGVLRCRNTTTGVLFTARSHADTHSLQLQTKDNSGGGKSSVVPCCTLGTLAAYQVRKCYFVIAKKSVAGTKVTLAHLAERATAWHGGFESGRMIYYSELWSGNKKTDNEDGLYLSSGRVRASQSRRRWSCACPGLRCACFPSHSDLVRWKKKWNINQRHYGDETWQIVQDNNDNILLMSSLYMQLNTMIFTQRKKEHTVTVQ